MALRHINIFLHIVRHVGDRTGQLALSVELRLLRLAVVIVRHLVILNNIAHLDRFSLSVILAHHQNRIVFRIQLFYPVRVKNGIYGLRLNMIGKVRIPVYKACNSVIHHGWIRHHINRNVLIERCQKLLRRISHCINLCTA